MSDHSDIPEVEETEGTGGVRGKAYPAISLEKAVERAEAIRNAGLTRSALPENAFFKLWNFKGASGPSRRVLAALNHYGLLDSLGKGKDRKLKLSDLALRILLDKVPGSAARSAALKEAALKPEIFTKLLDQFPFGVGTDQGIETFLTLNCGFLDEPAKIVKAAWRDTLAFAGLDKPDNMTPSAEQTPVGTDGKKGQVSQEVAIGDLVQVEISGAYTLEKPARVRAIRELDGGKWVFIDGSETGIPMEQVIVEQKGSGASPKPAPVLPLEDTPVQKGSRKEVFALDEGDVVLTFPDNLSPTSFADLDAYLKVFIGKMKRRAGVKEKLNAEIDTQFPNLDDESKKLLGKE